MPTYGTLHARADAAARAGVPVTLTRDEAALLAYERHYFREMLDASARMTGRLFGVSYRIRPIRFEDFQ